MKKPNASYNKEEPNRYKWKKIFSFVYVIIIFFLVLLLIEGSFKKSLIIFIFITILFGLYFLVESKKEHYLNKDFRKNLRDTFLICITIYFSFYFGFSLLYSGLKMDTSLPFKTYEFELYPSPNGKLVVRDFNINFNFKDSNGNLSFEMIEDEPLSSLSINIPKEINITNITLESNGITLIKSVEYEVEINQLNKTDRNYIIFDKFNQTLNNVKVNILLNEPEEFYPNGIFRLLIFAYRAYGTNARETIIFDLGHYRQDVHNFGKMINVEPEAYGNIIKIRYPPDYYENIDDKSSKYLHQEFTISSYSQRKKDKKEINTNLGIGFILAGVSLFIGELLRTILTLLDYPKKKDSKRKKC